MSPTAKKKAKGAHVVMVPKGIGCLNCGEEQVISYPCSINVLKGLGEGFTKDHLACKPSERGRKRFEYANADEWFDSWDTGVSSLTIFSTFKGYGAPERPDVPHDPADFGRCYRLLKVAPDWRRNLALVVAKNPAWGPLVGRWEELEKLYEEELPTGSAPRLYALMQSIAAGASS